MIEEFKYFILGLIQGITEFFPISSSGHIELFKYVANVAHNDPVLLMITVHFATALSTIFVYQGRIKNIIRGIIIQYDKSAISFCLKLLLSTIPIILTFIFLDSYIDNMFQNATVLVCIMLVCTGLLLISTVFIKENQNEINYKHAFFMGLAQAIAILPGISRSGSTISTAIFFKIERKKAAEFSFLMGLAPIIGGAIFKMINYTTGVITIDEIRGLLIAFFTAFFSGLFACRYMIKIVQNNSLHYFGFYCILIGLGFLVFIIL